MTARNLVAEELSKLFTLLSHPDRIRIIEELATHGERDVQSLSEGLKISQSRVSQHLSSMRAMRIVSERREGKRHIYHVERPELASWILQGIDFTEMRSVNTRQFESAVKKVRKIWSS